MRVITRNSVYTVKPTSGGMFFIERTASTWGQRVVERHTHVSRHISLGLGDPFITSNLRTSEVVAILPE